MPKISESFGGKWIKAADVGPRGLKGVIDEVTEEEVGQDKQLKIVVWIKGQEKGLILNATNANDLVSIYGDDTDTWKDKKIALKIARVNYQGKVVDGVRINLETIQNPREEPALSRKPAPPVTQEEADESEIPF